MERFLTLTDNLIQELDTSSVLSRSKLNRLEVQNHCILQIYDNGNLIPYQNSYSFGEIDDELLTQLHSKATMDGVLYNCQPQYSYVKRSPTYKLSQKGYGTFLGLVAVFPKRNGYLSLSILYTLAPQHALITKTMIIYALLGLIGAFIFHLIGRWLISKLLKPVIAGQKQQVDFIAAASHELRSPITYLQAAKSSLATDCLPFLSGEPKEALSDYLRISDEECLRMKRLIEDMLFLASSDNKTWSLKKKTIDLDSFFIDCFDTWNSYCEQTDHTLELVLPNDFLGNMELDSNRCKQIIEILLNNAISYTPKKTSIEICPFLSSKSLLIQIVDHGPGIPDEEKGRIFERYYRSDHSRTDKHHFGLGLNIALELTHLHNGDLTLSDTPGGGCTFTIKLS